MYLKSKNQIKNLLYTLGRNGKNNSRKMLGELKRTDFKVHRLKPVLHCRAASLESTCKRVEQQNCERDCGNGLLHFKHSHKCKKTLRISTFHFAIKWLMWILWSLWVTTGTVSTFHENCHDLWLQVPWLTHEALVKYLTNYSPQTKRKLGKNKSIQATEVWHSHRARALVSTLPTPNSSYPTKPSVLGS